MSDSHERTLESVERAPVVPEPATVPGATPSAHTGRFYLAYLVVVAVAVVGAIIGIRATSAVPPQAHVVHRWHAAGATPLAVSRAIAKHYTALRLRGFEPTTSPSVTVRRAGDLNLGGIQIPYGTGVVQIALPASDDVYVICGHGESCALLEPPTIKRELRLRRLVLALVVDTLASQHPPKHVLVSLPAGPRDLWLVVYGRDDFTDASLRKYRALLDRLAKAKKPAPRDLQLLRAVTSGRAYALRQEVSTEDANKSVAVMEPRSCFDSACPARG